MGLHFQYLKADLSMRPHFQYVEAVLSKEAAFPISGSIPFSMEQLFNILKQFFLFQKKERFQYLEAILSMRYM